LYVHTIIKKMKQLVDFIFVALTFEGYLCKKALFDWENNLPKSGNTRDISQQDQEIDDLIEMLREDDETNLVGDEVEDVCADVHCGPGRTCEEGNCVCVKACVPERDPRRFVCSNLNRTHDSDCSVYRARCLCEEGSPECQTELHRHMHIEYYGSCREMSACQEDEITDFPRRMREWLDSVMEDLSEKGELTPHYKNILEAENIHLADHQDNQSSRRWSASAVWKWCDLDKHPHDNVVSRHELFPLRAPLYSLEHCISPFLDNCDKDDDHSITIQEWADCLELNLEDFVDQCETLDH